MKRIPGGYAIDKARFKLEEIRANHVLTWVASFIARSGIPNKQKRASQIARGQCLDKPDMQVYAQVMNGRIQIECAHLDVELACTKVKGALICEMWQVYSLGKGNDQLLETFVSEALDGEYVPCEEYKGSPEFHPARWIQ